MKRLITKYRFQITTLETLVFNNLTIEIHIQHSKDEEVLDDLSQIEAAASELRDEWNDKILMNHRRAMSVFDTDNVAFVTFEPTMHNIADFVLLHHFPRKLIATAAVVFRVEVNVSSDGKSFTAVSEL